MLIRQTALYLPAQLLGPLAQLAAIVLWTHWLDPGEFGAFTLALAAQEAIYLLFLAFWSYYLLRFLPGADAPARERMDTFESWVLLANLALQAAALGLVLRYLAGTPPGAAAFAVLFAFAFTRSYCTHLAERAKAGNDILAYTALQCGGPIGGLALGWLWAHLTRDGAARIGPLQVLGAYAIAQAASLLFALLRLPLRWRLRRADRGLLRAVALYGLPLALSGALAWVPGNGIRFVVEHGLGLAAVGLFAAGWTLGQRACAFAAMLVTAAAFPIALRLEASGERGRALQQLADNGALLCAVLLPSAAGLIALSAPLSQLAVSAPYVADTLVILPIATLAGLVKNLRSHFANQAFLLARKTGWTLAIDALETALFLIGAALGLRALGLAGAAWGALAAVSVGAALSFFVAVRRLDMPLPSAHLARIVLASAAMSAALALLPPLAGWPALALATAFGGAVYAGVLALCYRGHLRELRGRIPFLSR
ncbi:Membrane protein involved in the export of O-antigen and teichoic acid [Lysobacter sp. yr284]|uniref:lipopolysaccharide biosynthesis protein n=1 Tax=Lysobacter TaxID=68 RepID=UPI00089B5705|nr:polysaccharide biosynthesis C-terminal domain-containing protein [Lysobacter sp. yr284]SDY56466.1 Membrane protein involved in the export of O-antigen and teichoic acid [Lysobacter sp. yr284]